MSDHTPTNHADALLELQAAVMREFRGLNSALFAIETYANLAALELAAEDIDPLRVREPLDWVIRLAAELREELNAGFAEQLDRPPEATGEVSTDRVAVREWAAGIVLAGTLRVEIDREPREGLLLETLQQALPGLGDEIEIPGRLRSFCEGLQEQLLDRPLPQGGRDA